MFIIFIDLLKEPVLGVTGLLCRSLFRISLPQRSPSFSYFLGASGAPQTAPHLVWGWTPPGQSHLPAPHFLNPLSPSASKFHMKICSKVEHSSQILQEKPMCGFWSTLAPHTTARMTGVFIPWLCPLLTHDHKWQAIFKPQFPSL